MFDSTNKIEYRKHRFAMESKNSSKQDKLFAAHQALKFASDQEEIDDVQNFIDYIEEEQSNPQIVFEKQPDIHHLNKAQKHVAFMLATSIQDDPRITESNLEYDLEARAYTLFPTLDRKDVHAALDVIYNSVGVKNG